MAEIRRHFFCRGWSDLDKISETGAEWHVDCGDVVEIETICRIPNMADVWTNSMACHLRATCHIVGPGEFIGMSSRATYHIAGCYHLVNSMSRFQSHMPHCRVESPGEINVMIVPHCSVQEFHQPYWKSFFTIFNFYGRPLSVSGRPCYILPMFF